MQDFFRELKDRKVIKVGIAYVVGAFVVMESADIMFPALDCLENSVTSRTWIENDPDLNALRDKPRYKALVGSLPS